MEIFKPIPSWNSIVTPKIPKVPWTWTRTIPYMPPIPREILNPSISRIYPLLPPRPPLPRLHQRRLFIISSTLSLSRCNISRQLLANISRHFNPSRAISIRIPSEYVRIFLSFVRHSNVNFSIPFLPQFLRHCEIVVDRLRYVYRVPSPFHDWI